MWRGTARPRIRSGGGWPPWPAPVVEVLLAEANAEPGRGVERAASQAPERRGLRDDERLARSPCRAVRERPSTGAEARARRALPARRTTAAPLVRTRLRGRCCRGPRLRARRTPEAEREPSASSSQLATSAGARGARPGAPFALFEVAYELHGADRESRGVRPGSRRPGAGSCHDPVGDPDVRARPLARWRWRRSPCRAGGVLEPGSRAHAWRERLVTSKPAFRARPAPASASRRPTGCLRLAHQQHARAPAWARPGRQRDEARQQGGRAPQGRR